MTWTCQKCGKTFPTEKQYKNHACNLYETKYLTKCPKCGGTGKISGFLEPNRDCSYCNGTGKV